MRFLVVLYFISLSLKASESQDLSVRKDVVLSFLRTCYLQFPPGRKEINFCEDVDAQFFKDQMLQYAVDPKRDGLLFRSIFQMGIDDFKSEKFELILFKDSMSKEYRVVFGLKLDTVKHIDVRLPNRIRKMFEIAHQEKAENPSLMIRRRLAEIPAETKLIPEKEASILDRQLVVYQEKQLLDTVNSIPKKSCCMM